MVQVSLLGGFGTPFVLDHAAFNKTVNARASLGTGRTSRVHSVVFPSLTWLYVLAPAPVLLSGFYLSWRASSTRNTICQSWDPCWVLFREPCSLEAQLSSLWTRHSLASTSQTCEPTSS